jgi:hypothetical protein
MDTSTSSGLIGLLPFWILIAGALLVAASSWLDPKVRNAEVRHRDDVPEPTPHRGYRPNEVDPMR